MIKRKILVTLLTTGMLLGLVTTDVDSLNTVSGVSTYSIWWPFDVKGGK